MGDLVYARLHDDIAPPAGIVFSSTHEVVKETIGTFALSYRVVDAKPAYLDLFAGARVYSFYSEIVLRPNLPGGTGFAADGTTTWADPIVGLRGRYYVSRAVFLNGYGDVGGFGAGSELSWQVLGGIGVQAARWCDVQLGYRALGFEYDGARGKQEITTHGPIIGATIRLRRTPRTGVTKATTAQRNGEPSIRLTPPVTTERLNRLSTLPKRVPAPPIPGS